MGDGNYDLKQAYRPGAVSPHQETLDDRLVVPASSGIVAVDGPSVTSSPGFARRVLSSAYDHTLGRLYHPSETFVAVETPAQASSLDAVVDQAVTETAAGSAGREQSASRLRRVAPFVKGTGLGVGATILAYNVEDVGGFVYQVVVKGYEVVAPLIEVASHHPLSATIGAVLVPALAHRYSRSRGKRLGKLRLAVTSAGGAAIGIGAGVCGSELFRLADGIVGKVRPSITSAVVRADSIIWSGERYGHQAIDTATSFLSRFEPSLAAFLNIAPELGVAVAGGAILLDEARQSARSQHKELTSRAVVVNSLAGAAGGIGLYHLIPPGLEEAADISSSFGSHIIVPLYHALAPYGPAIALGATAFGFAAGVTVAFVKSPKLRRDYAFLLQSAGSLVAKGASVSKNFVSQKASAAYQALTPSPEFTRQHRGWTTGGLVGIGAGLTMAAAALEPVKDAVVHTISAGDVGLAAIVGTALAGTMEYLWTYRSHRR